MAEQLEQLDEEECVWVRRQWNDYRIGAFRLADVSGLHWSNVSGGVHALAPREFLHGYVSCQDILYGELAHSCQHGRGPHWNQNLHREKR